MNERHDCRCCFICDKSFIINQDNTTNHLTKDGEVDYDEDANHIPYRIKE